MPPPLKKITTMRFKLVSLGIILSLFFDNDVHAFTSSQFSRSALHANHIIRTKLFTPVELSSVTAPTINKESFRMSAQEGRSDEIVGDGDSTAVDKTKGTKLAQFRKSFGRYFRSSDRDDGLTTKQRLAKMGLATVLSYGWISNTNAMILVAAAWYVFSVKVRVMEF